MPKFIYTQRHQKLLSLLKGARKSKSLTQAQVAERIGRPQSFVAKYERGERRLDLLEFLEIAHAIEFDPHEFLDDLERE